VPVFFLDTDIDGNNLDDRALTGQLYGGDARYRFRQEVVLGIGGVAVLEALGIGTDLQFHMNEGHSALLTLALLERVVAGRQVSRATKKDFESVRSHCVFTTHTPVPAGHDRFPVDLVRAVLGDERTRALERLDCLTEGHLNMTHLALHLSRYINGVAMRHGDVSRDMFPRYPINAITNGVHAITWASEPMRRLFDRHMGAWRLDNVYLRYALKIPLDEILAAHMEAKRTLIEEIDKRLGVRLNERVFTIGFARRAAQYKRADLIFKDLERLRAISRQVGEIQIIFGGKAHPHDEPAKELIRSIYRSSQALEPDVTVVYIENYDMHIAKHLVAGVDLWLNTPRPPQEASGTSGMKAALNGVPSLSGLDGWWIEGHLENVTGWSFGECAGCGSDTPGELASLYHKLEAVILPLYYRQPADYAAIMRSAIAINGSFFNTQRMVLQYLTNAYFPASEPANNNHDSESKVSSAAPGTTTSPT
jgi:starch phosphorylase